MDMPTQKFHEGDLVVATEDYYNHLKEGEFGVITLAFCHEVCIKSGIEGLRPEEGGAEFAMEWGYVGLFDVTTRPQGVRLDRLSPVRVVS